MPPAWKVSDSRSTTLVFIYSLWDMSSSFWANCTFRSCHSWSTKTLISEVTLQLSTFFLFHSLNLHHFETLKSQPCPAFPFKLFFHRNVAPSQILEADQMLVSLCERGLGLATHGSTKSCPNPPLRRKEDTGILGHATQLISETNSLFLSSLMSYP